MDYWNELIKLKNSPDLSDEDKQMCIMLLKQLNTAGGKELMGCEVETFLSKFEK